MAASKKLKLPEYYPVPNYTDSVGLTVIYSDEDGERCRASVEHPDEGEYIPIDEAEKFMRAFTRLVKGAMSLNENGTWPDEVTGDFGKVWSMVKEQENVSSE